MNFYSIIFIFLSTIACNDRKAKTNTTEKSSNPETNSDYLFAPVKQADSSIIPNDTYVPLFYKGQLAHWIRTINEDENGNLWFGTNHYGVIRYNNAGFKYFTQKEGFGDSRVSAVITEANGDVYFGTSRGLTKYHSSSERFSYLTVSDGLIHNEIWSMIKASNGIIWIGTSEGVNKFDGKTITKFSIPKAYVANPLTLISYNRITSIMEDSHGNLWFGTDGFGICKYDGNSFTHFTKSDGLCDNTISSIMEDSSGTIWIGTMFGGVSLYNGKSFKNLTEENLIQGIEISAFYEDIDGTIWFAVEHNGVYSYDGKTFTNYNSNSGLGSTGIISIFRDSKNRFWFGGWKGLYRFNGKRFDTVTKSN